MMLRTLLLLSLWLFGACAQIRQGDGNLTVAFFPSSEEATCKQDNVTNAVTLTTNTVPSSWVCFNLTDLFSQPSDTGTQNGYGSTKITPYHGVDYLLSNRGSYNAATNYTNVWHQQINQTDDITPGANGSWVLYTYTYESCGYDDSGSFKPPNSSPYFATSCQTNDAGECQQLPRPIKSFAIAPGFEFNGDYGCKVWAQMGGASVLSRRTAALFVVAVTMATLLVL